MTNAKNEVNFSDRTPKRVDPHKWQEEMGKVIDMRGRVLNTITVWHCIACDRETTRPPKYIHDLPPCSPTEPPVLIP
jgi:hypothetical protein